MKTVITYCVLLFSVGFCYGQFTPLSKGEGPGVRLKSLIANYSNQPLYIYKCGIYPAICGSNTLLLIDSTITDKKGAFAFFFNHDNHTNHKNHNLFRFIGSSDNGALYK